MGGYMRACSGLKRMDSVSPWGAAVDAALGCSIGTVSNRAPAGPHRPKLMEGV